jgi:uncharacterized membrane protein YdbT with pleckstrin-like domain
MRCVQEEEDAPEGSELWPEAELRRRRGAAKERITDRALHMPLDWIVIRLFAKYPLCFTFNPLIVIVIRLFCK